MKHGNFDKIPKDYKTFAELAEYAKQRARVSAARNGHQEFAYWLRVAEWASDNGSISPGQQLKYYQTGVLQAAVDGNYSLAAQHYACAVHCRRMLINRGQKPPRLSLAWLREAAKKL